MSRGYTLFSAYNLMRLAAHFSRWLMSRDIHLEKLKAKHVDLFLVERRQSGYQSFLSRYALVPILNSLEHHGIIPSLELLTPPPLEPPLKDYRNYLLHERSVTVGVADRYLVVAQRLLDESFPHASFDLHKLNPEGIVSFVLAESRRFSAGTTKYTVTALRSFLHFLYIKGEITSDLAKVVPAIAGQRHCGLPKGLDVLEIQQLLRTCDRRTHMGRKDFALLLLLVRLGLRCCEVATLEFEDINWRQGEITIRGKGQEERLPLPDDVGQALTRYLQIRRSTEDRHVFLRSRAPTGALSRNAIKMIVRKHLINADISPPQPHRLRHTAATQLLRQGATLDQVAQVLRHRSFETTVIYAKVDHDRLSALSQPWPEVGHE